MKYKWLYILFLIPAFSTCLESPEMTTGIVNGKEKPTVITVGANPLISDGNLLFQGEIVSGGKADIKESGFYWDTIPYNLGRSEKNNIVYTNVKTGVFDYKLENARGGRIYYWQAFARNSYGEDVGDVQSFTTPPIWEPKASFNANPRSDGAVFYLNGNIYISCGQERLISPPPLTATWEYNIIKDEWSEIKSFTAEARISPISFVIGNYAIVGTGRSNTEFNNFRKYNSVISDWEEIANHENLEARYDAVAFSLNGKGYLVGGISNRVIMNDVWQYDLELDSWEKMNNFPVSFNGGISISGNNRVFTGFGSSGSSRKLWEYNEKTDDWVEFAELHNEVGWIISSGVIINNTIYIVDDNNIIWACNMDSENKIWKKKTDLPVEFLNQYGEGGNQNLITTGNSNSIYVGLGYTRLLYEYRPLWDN